MKRIYQKLVVAISTLYIKLNTFILAIMVLGILELGIYYDLLLSVMAILAPEMAPLLIIAFIWITYKGIRRLYLNSKNKKFSFI